MRTWLGPRTSRASAPFRPVRPRARSVAAPVNGVGAVWKERVPPAATAKLSSASGAAAYAASPGCVAATVQVPGPSSVNTVPCNVHVPGVSDVRLTGSPELAAALTR